MDLHIAFAGRDSLSRQIYRQLFDAVLEGRLRPGERLPPTRELARRLDVARNTVAQAYERLVGEGILAGHVGSGTFVSLAPVGRTQGRRAPSGSAVRPRRVWNALPAPWSPGAGALPATFPDPAFDLRAGSPDAALFPFTTWRRLVARELKPSRARWSDYGDPAGHAGLRAAIARHVGVSRGVRASADDLIVTQGAQQALDLVGRVLVEPGTCVAVEEPGYPPARNLFRSLGARVRPVRVDDEGIVVASIPRDARLVYVTPSHQFPLGMAMSLPRRAALLAWAERSGAVVIEDDYDSEFRHAGRPLDPIQNLDRGGHVVYVGSFSKVMLPALRLGFLIAPASLQGALRTAKALADWHGDPATQAALARFIDEGLLARHIRKAGRRYADRQARVAAALERDFAAWLQPVPSAAGLPVAAHSAVALDMRDVARRAEALGVAVRPLSYFCAEPARRDGMVIGFGSIPDAKLDEGLRRLAGSFRASQR
jgi:GntR family transcriptional regulator/MocR family aminotransferase